MIFGNNLIVRPEPKHTRSKDGNQVGTVWILRTRPPSERGPPGAPANRPCKPRAAPLKRKRPLLERSEACKASPRIQLMRKQ